MVIHWPIKKCFMLCYGLIIVLVLLLTALHRNRWYRSLDLVRPDHARRDVIEACGGPDKDGRPRLPSGEDASTIFPSWCERDSSEQPREELQAKKWIKVEPSTQVWGQAAYFDNRTDVYGGPVAVAMGFRESRDEKKSGLSLYCHFTYGDRKCDLCTGAAIIYKLEPRDDSLYALVLSSYLVCPLPSHHPHPPLSLYFTTQACCSDHHTPPIPVIAPPTKPPELALGICLHKGLFSLTDPQVVIQFMELHRLLGVQWFTIYIQDVPNFIQGILRSYVAEGIAEIVEWNLNISDFIVRDYGQLAVIHDCLYRNRGRVKYLGFMDFDEVFVPRTHSTLPELLQSVDREEYGSFRFMNVFYHSDNSHPAETHQAPCPAVSTPPYFVRSLRTDYNENYHLSYRSGKSKVIVKPESIVKMGRHTMHLRKLHQFAPHYSEYTIPGTLGLMHHYRMPDVFPERLPLQRDAILLKYSHPLMTAIEEKLCHR